MFSRIALRARPLPLARRYGVQAAKSLKPASFSLPKEQKIESPELNQEQNKAMHDFLVTKLVSGRTDLRIGITDAAKDKLVEISSGPDSALRIKVESGGCHGFQYNLELTNVADEAAKDDDLVIFERTDNGLAKVIFDESSLEILQDSKVDYTTELIGSSFKVVDSPYTSTLCGCGASFDFDFEKLAQSKQQ